MKTTANDFKECIKCGQICDVATHLPGSRICMTSAKDFKECIMCGQTSNVAVHLPGAHICPSCTTKFINTPAASSLIVPEHLRKNIKIEVSSCHSRTPFLYQCLMCGQISDVADDIPDAHICPSCTTKSVNTAASSLIVPEHLRKNIEIEVSSSNSMFLFSHQCGRDTLISSIITAYCEARDLKPEFVALKFAHSEAMLDPKQTVASLFNVTGRSQWEGKYHLHAHHIPEKATVKECSRCFSLYRDLICCNDGMCLHCTDAKRLGDLITGESKVFKASGHDCLTGRTVNHTYTPNKEQSS